MIAGVGKVINRRANRRFLTILIAVGILVVLVVVPALLLRRAMSFDFLNGRRMTTQIERDPAGSAYRTVRYVYSFPGDFDDVCAMADPELSAKGFKISFRERRGVIQREYRLSSPGSPRFTVVSIRGRQQVKVHSTPELSRNSGRARVLFHYRRGWVSVHVTRVHRRFWPPRHLLYHLRSRPRPVPVKPKPTGFQRGNLPSQR
jgi:hypothetical protein